MQGINERLAHLKRHKFKGQESIVDIAILLSDYLSSVDNLQQVKMDLEHPKSSLFLSLTRFGRLGTSTYLYCDRFINATIELMSDSTNPERQILSNLSAVLTRGYEHPTTNVQGNIDDLRLITLDYMDLSLDDLVNKEQSKQFCIMLYTVYRLVALSIDNLSGMKKALAAILIDLSDMKDIMLELMELLEDKVDELDRSIKAIKIAERNSLTIQKSIQDHFNDRFSCIINGEEQDEIPFTSLEHLFDGVSYGLNEIIEAREHREELVQAVEKIEDLIAATEENDLKIVRRYYFLELIQQNFEAYNVLIRYSSGAKKQELEANINRYNNPTLSSKILYGMSNASILVTMLYRWSVSQTIQDAVAAKLPATLDSECKAGLKELAYECLDSLKAQIVESGENILQLTNTLADGNKELASLIQKEPTAYLTNLISENKAAHEAICQYKKLWYRLEEQTKILIPFLGTHKALDHFIETHNNWFMKLLNFLVKISPVFKTETAKVIDKANDLKRLLTEFEKEYNNQFKAEMEAVENNPDLPKELKIKFKNEFALNRIVSRHPVENKPRDKEEVCRLMEPIFTFFSDKKIKNKPNPPVKETDSELLIDHDLMVVSNNT